MPDYLLDTMILDYWYDTNCLQHAKVVSSIGAVCIPDPQTQYIPRLFVSVVTLGEIEYGHRVELKRDLVKQAEFTKFVRDHIPEPLEIMSHVAEPYGDLRAWLFNKFSPRNKRSKAKRVEELVDPTTARELGVQENDLWIAAQALTHNFVLVTHDSKGNFGKLLQQFASTLRVEDWAQ